MPKFRKKPVVIEAINLQDVLNNNNVPRWLTDATGIKVFLTYSTAIIHTLEGKMYATNDDWIIQGVSGELYPCKNDIFFKTYEKVEEV